ncbi:MAG: hypothetical protein ACE5JU_09940 [Candidatus Binatia bacterium]
MPLNDAEIVTLRNDLATNPRAQKPADVEVLSDGELARLYNEVQSTITIIKDSITGDEFFAAIDRTELNALADADREWVRHFHRLGGINLKDPNVEGLLRDLFPADSTTRANLIALATRNGSDAERLFGPGRTVHHTDFARAFGRT